MAQAAPSFGFQDRRGPAEGEEKRPMLYRVEGIVIRSMDYGEGNKIVTLLTPGHGKQGVVIRGARKPKSRYGALAQLFTYGEYAFYKSGSLGTLSSGEVIEPFRELREGLEGPAYASYAAELTDKAITDEEASGYLFGQLRACLTALAQGKDPAVILRIYEMKVAAQAGYSPVLDACVNCGRTEGEFVFSAPAGGALCPLCRERDRSALVLDEGVWKLLRLFSRLDLGRIGSISVKDSSKKQLQAVMRSWMDTHMGLKLKSRNFLDQMERAFDNPDTVG
jgi:DNA repair protein RecO (recombination protein O)